MRVAVVRFPGSNCDQDAVHALRDATGVDAEYVWHEETSLTGFDGAFLPGGFSFGDYLRCGAMAARSPVMEAVRAMAEAGRPVVGSCNGFQILCEVGLLPGALLANAHQRFECRDVWLAAEGSSPWVRGVERPLRLPIAHGEGRFVCDSETLARIEASGAVAFRYVDASGRRTPEGNPNGSLADIAGVTNAAGNVLGMMPHPERATSELLGSADGLPILRVLAEWDSGRTFVASGDGAGVGL